MLKTRVIAAALGAAFVSAAVIGTVAQEGTPVVEETTAVATEGTTEGTTEQREVQTEPIIQQGGAEGLVAAVVQIADVIDITDSNIEVVTIQIEDSLNDLDVLNDVLNNSPILSDNTIIITDVIEIGTIEDVIAIGVLDGGDLILFSRG